MRRTPAATGSDARSNAPSATGFSAQDAAALAAMYPGRAAAVRSATAASNFPSSHNSGSSSLSGQDRPARVPSSSYNSDPFAARGVGAAARRPSPARSPPASSPSLPSRSHLSSQRPSAAGAASSAASYVPPRPARPSAAPSSSPAVDSDIPLDLEGLLGWSRDNAAERAREDRARRERILARERDLQLMRGGELDFISRERRNLQRLGGESREMSAILASMLARSEMLASGLGGEEPQGPVIDPETGRPKVMCLTLRCFSFAMVERANEQGDKIILPAEALYNMEKLRLPFPFLFRLEKVGDSSQRQHASSALLSPPLSQQYAGVLEFSAPAEQVHLPRWMMENLRLDEGDSVRVFSESHVEQGRWVKLVPHSKEFSTLLRELGPKYFLENALRHYSVLSKGQRIMVSHAGKHYSLDVVDSKPAANVSILGKVDLEVEFGPALDAPRDEREEQDGSQTFRARGRPSQAPPLAAEDEDEELKRAMALSLAESQAAIAAEASEAPSAEASPAASPSPVEDEGWSVVPSAAAAAPPPSGLSSLQARFGSGNRLGGGVGGASLSAAASDPYESKYDERAASPPAAAAAASSPPAPESKEEDEDDDDDSDEEADAAAGGGSVDVPPGHQLCPSCKRPIASSSFALHELHCARAFTKCAVCARMVKKVEAAQHAAGHERVECEQCHASLERRKMKKHARRECVYRPAVCKWCTQSVPLIQLPSHEHVCGNVTQNCSRCEQAIPHRLLAEHPSSDACRIKCLQCDDEVASKDIVMHMKEGCAGRPIECPHCHLSFPFRETVKHEEYCGSRTEQCDACQRYIKLRDMKEHVDSACFFPPAEAKPAAAPPAAASVRVERERAPAAARRPSPPPAAATAPSDRPGIGAAGRVGFGTDESDRVRLLSAMLDSGAEIDPAVMSALLAQSIAIEDPAGAAAARRNAQPARAAAVRPKPASRDPFSTDEDDEVWDSTAPTPAVRKPAPLPAPAPASRPMPAPAARAARAPSPAAARASGRAAAAPAPASGAFPCAYCSDRCASLESLQVHILTECHDAHTRMEAADPAAAAKALNGLSVREHISVKVPVASPVAPSRKPAATGSAAAPLRPSSLYDPYEPVSRGSGSGSSSRKFSAPVVISSDSDEDDRAVTAADVRAASKLAAASKPKLSSSSVAADRTGAGAKPAVRSGTAAALHRRDSDLDGDDDALFASRLSSYNAATTRPSRSSAATVTPGSLKQQQRELEASIAARRAGASATALGAASKPRSTTSSAAPSRLSAANDAGAHSRNSSRSSSGSGVGPRASGVSPSFGALNADHALSSSSSSASSSARSGRSNPNEDFERFMANLRVSHAQPSSSSSSLASAAAGADVPRASAISRSAYDPLAYAPPRPAAGAGVGGGAAHSSYFPSSYSSESALASTSTSSSSSFAASPGAARLGRDRPAFDRPLSIPKATSSAAMTATGYGARAHSPPSHQKPAVSSNNSSSYSNAPHSSAAYTLPSRSAATAGDLLSGSNARARAAARAPSSAASFNPHTPQFVGTGSSNRPAPAARRSNGSSGGV